MPMLSPTVQDIKDAVDRVISGKESMAGVARSSSVGLTTIKKWVSIVKEGGKVTHRKPGPRPKLGAFEKDIVSWTVDNICK